MSCIFYGHTPSMATPPAKWHAQIGCHGQHIAGNNSIALCESFMATATGKTGGPDASVQMEGNLLKKPVRSKNWLASKLINANSTAF